MPNLSISSLMSLFGCIDTIEDRMIWISSSDFSRQIYLSPCYEKLFEKDLAEQYKDPSSVFTALAFGDHQKLIDRIIHRNNVNSYQEDKIDYRVRRRSGSILWIEDRAFRVVDEMGRCIAHAGIANPAERQNEPKNNSYALISKQQSMRDEVLKLLSDECGKLNLEYNQLAKSNVTLTPKEVEVLEYLKCGKSAKQTAALMCISTRTVEFHINNLKEKTKSRTKLEILGKFVHPSIISE